MTSPWTPTPSSTGVERVGFLPHRGRGRTPGQLRTTQNPIGAPSSTIETADSVPPPPDGLPDLLRDWERFANEGAEMPLLVQNALLHSQVEMIRPFSTATDAFGRLLLVFCLVSRGRLPAPLLYRSAYLERNRQRYYAAVQSVLETGDACRGSRCSSSPSRSRRAMPCRAPRGPSSCASATEGWRRRWKPRRGGVGRPGVREPAGDHPLVEERLGVPTAVRLLRQLERARGAERRKERLAWAASVRCAGADGDRDG